MAYGNALGVARLCRNILGDSSNFTTSTSPALIDVNDWLSSGCSIIESTISSLGYTVPVTPSQYCHGLLEQLNELYAAAWVEMSRTNVRLGPGERTRGQVFLEEFYGGLDRLGKMNLASLGLSATVSAPIYAGGISQSDKDTVVDDTDRVEPRFKRGQFQDPGVLWPSDTQTSAS